MCQADVHGGCQEIGDEMSPEPTLPMALALGGFLFVILFFTGWYLILDRRADARHRAAENDVKGAAPGEPEGAAEGIELRVTGAEALVLFEWLAAAYDDGALDVDEAQRRVLWDLGAQLETKLTEPFLPEYAQLVDAAKKTVLGVSAAEGE
jgi:hypothetical protein